MFHQPDYEALHNNPDANCCWNCGVWRFDCEHLAEPVTSPILKLNRWYYIEVTWQAGVSRSAAIAFGKSPNDKGLIRSDAWNERAEGFQLFGKKKAKVSRIEAVLFR